MQVQELFNEATHILMCYRTTLNNNSVDTSIVCVCSSGFIDEL